ncbi:glycosyltransferase family 3 protein [Gonapodya prolifera JEL478]|uniref:Glycogen [starch] synthase n=1 Tax=Gonapodya prolifera (strain JEL478) TaxID=1344416 RepID=A0A139AVZ7_GONPJ|nr:glycosyltransferase family 3 protein [Gonapodya prolifera JEL478]|eukprot:KXS20645.1 glycosyltransferase family 3 protein [Gonapodya prolifera JEL478]
MAENGDADFSRPLLFEVAWEVANKVGTIYTVIKSKVPFTVEEYGNRYCLIGPFSPKTGPMEVEPIENPASAPLRDTLKQMRDKGIRVTYGRWLVEGGPAVILFDVASAHNRIGEWKTDLEGHLKVPFPADDYDTNEAVAFGYLVSWFFDEFPAPLADASDADRKTPLVLAHFHEWMAGVALPLVKAKKIPLATVFTVHNTLLGRYLCAGDVDFYNNLKRFDVESEATKRGILHRYAVERAAVQSSDVFTAVSHITAYEAEWLCQRKPDGVLPNGLNVVKFSALHEFQNLHAIHKERIHEFVRGHFYGHYDFDLERTLYVFTAGRYEYRNKGIDMFIDGLARLNKRLISSGSTTTIVAFIVMPAATLGYTVDSLKGQAVMKQLTQTAEQVERQITERLMEVAARGRLPTPKDLLDSNDLVLLKRRVYALRRDQNPPVVTHNMADEDNDPILNQLKRVGLNNAPGDRVKVVFHPEYLNANNPLFGMDYDDFVRGCHLGVFPSYYEPWGYTPAECTVMGVPTITTNLSGYGCFMDESVSNPRDYGIYILDRRVKSPEESASQLVNALWDFVTKNRRQRINQRNRTERLSDLLDWRRLGVEYQKARWVAVKRKFPQVS